MISQRTTTVYRLFNRAGKPQSERTPFDSPQTDSNSDKRLLQRSAENTTEMVPHYSETGDSTASEANDSTSSVATDSNFQLNNTNDRLINLSRKSILPSDSGIDLPECMLTLPVKVTTKETLSADADPKLHDSFLC